MPPEPHPDLEFKMASLRRRLRAPDCASEIMVIRWWQRFDGDPALSPLGGGVETVTACRMDCVTIGDCGFTLESHKFIPAPPQHISFEDVLNVDHKPVGVFTVDDMHAFQADHHG